MRKSSSLYVERLVLKDIRCFERLEIQFSKLGESMVVIGDNGEGKSTVLRALAMGICDQSSASALFRELYGDYVRAGAVKPDGTIQVDLKGAGRYRYRIETHIKSLDRFERVEQVLYRITGNRTKELSQDEFPWQRIFASAYGPGIRVQGTSDFDDYLTVDAVYPLFRYDVLLQNPELVIRRLVDGARRRRGKRAANVLLRRIRELLAHVLQLETPNHISLESTGIYVKGRAGKVILSAVADGLRGTLTWVLDLIAWWFVHCRECGPTQFLDVRGIVLIDEVEQHLHPQWQRNIMRLLADSFPHVQFIATTHSPLVASGCEGIPVHRLDQGRHSIERPFGWLAEDVYRMMGVSSSRSDSFRIQILDEFRMLDSKRLHRSAKPSDLRRLRALRRKLDLLPATDPVRLTTEIENIRQRLELKRASSRRGEE